VRLSATGLTSVTDHSMLKSTELYRLKLMVDGMPIVIRSFAMESAAMDRTHGKVPIRTAECMLLKHQEHWMPSHAEVLHVIRGGVAVVERR